jgi:nitrogen-specific signal transduction histidine kinase
MDQAPVQNVDIVKSLETTLTILNHKLKHGVTVQRDYQRIPLLVNSFGSELNQVWTNIIDNAIDAMGGKGELESEPIAMIIAWWWRSATTAREFRPRSKRTSSNHSSPPRESAREPGSASTPCSAS